MCFFPIETYKVHSTSAAERKYHYHSSGKNKLYFPTNKYYGFAKRDSRAELCVLPCGKCEKCLSFRAKNWAIRAMHEARYYEQNSFITLTYKDSHLPFKTIKKSDITENKKHIDKKEVSYCGGINTPENPATLYKRDFQLFMKRLRKELWKDYGVRIKYLMCGEYGEKRSRPHYHALIFGFQFPDLSITSNNAGCEYNIYNSEMLARIWSHGVVKVGNVSMKSAAYVCRYTMKKMYGGDGIKEYQLTDRIPPYLACSHGIGRRFYEEYETQILQNDYILHPETMSRCQLPRYYDKLIEKKFGENKLQKIKQKRLYNFSKKYKMEEDTPQRRAEKREVYLSKIKRLRRNYEECEQNSNTS